MWLKELDLWDNYVINELPNTVFVRLKHSRLDNNKFTFAATRFLGVTMSLQELDLQDNSITGELPNAVFLRLMRLWPDNK
ncbi:hypothetical protein D1007_29521 [Hordeum vulgare]|nr:hypothetical protein D1007_29521 [Hordeum vulgare]